MSRHDVLNGSVRTDIVRGIAVLQTHTHTLLSRQVSWIKVVRKYDDRLKPGLESLSSVSLVIDVYRATQVRSSTLQKHLILLLKALLSGNKSS